MFNGQINIQNELDNKIAKMGTYDLEKEENIKTELKEPSVLNSHFNPENKREKIIRVYRHGDRTPKQKIKVKLSNLINTEEMEVVVKEDFERAINFLQNIDNERVDSIIKILKEKKNEKGVKLQLKVVKDIIEIILKWGGVLTHTGRLQCKEKGQMLRYEIVDEEHNYKTNKDKSKTKNNNEDQNDDKEYGLFKDKFNNNEVTENGIRETTMLDKIKVYSAAEGRVYESAQLFAKSFSFSDLNVVQDKNMLDDTFQANGFIEEGRQDLKSAFDKFKTADDERFFLDTILNINLEVEVINNKPETQGIIHRWNYIKKSIVKDGCMSYSRVSEINDNLKYDLIHNNDDLQKIFVLDKMVEFYLVIQKYYRFILENEYGKDSEYKKKTSKAISGPLLNKILADIDDEDGVKIYFTKESRMYTLFNLVNVYHSKIKEFDYCSSIGFDVYELNSVKRIRVIFNRGIKCGEIVDGCLDVRHRVPYYDDEILYDMEVMEFKNLFL